MDTNLKLETGLNLAYKRIMNDQYIEITEAVSKVDNIIFRQIGDQIFSPENHNGMSTHGGMVEEWAAGKGLRRDQVRDCFNVLETNRLLNCQWDIGGGAFQIQLTPRGFGMYASVFIPQVKGLPIIIIDEFMKNKVDGSLKFAEIFNVSNSIVMYVLDLMEAKGDIKVRRWMGGSAVTDVSIAIKRRYDPPKINT